ncbi:MAG: bifunctional UDP-N-acetylglucosamine diphosphorylase/glucosamine-1-phosphate N-acetyltransferase GlmU [Alphaproteobacteria bacterium]|nr:bifunctional UDP-N-acetylglucosamine diphosphorylase/glucosamine-1-phosphate N-acetyltransferase GlmU [Alphaproteobacteria bacterium]
MSPGNRARPSRAAIVLAAGQGTRMKSRRPKVMHAVAGRPMLGHLLTALKGADVERIVVVAAPGQDEIANYAKTFGAEIAIQDRQLGTGHAAASAREALDHFAGTAIVLYGDNPLLTVETLEKLFALRESGADLALMGFRPEHPGPYGRLILDAKGSLQAIVEAKDATPEQARIDLCNAGGFVLEAKRLFALLARLSNENAQGEYYLTEIVALARAEGAACRVVEVAADEVLGVNSRAELAVVERLCQQRLRAAAMAGGATLADPETVYFSADTILGKDVTIGPNVVFGPGVTVADNVEIRAFCHLEGATIAEGAIIGPFARLRPGTVLHENVHIGNFVETKKAVIGAGAKANHLTYLGDATIGAGANIGAGTITCNYDGFDKFETVVGAGAFIGSNSALVAPVTIGAGAYVGAGSVVTKPVAPDALAVERAKQSEIKDWAANFRARKTAERAAKAAKKE